jgi:hypothetical protein
MSVRIYGPEQRERYSGAAEFIGQDIEALAILLNTVIRALEVRLATVEAGTFSSGIDVTGDVSFGTHSAIGAETVTGYITITDSGGTTRKLAVVS